MTTSIKLNVSDAVANAYGVEELQICVKGNNTDSFKNTLDKREVQDVYYTKGSNALCSKHFSSVNQALLHVVKWPTVNAYEHLYTLHGTKAKDIRKNGGTFINKTRKKICHKKLTSLMNLIETQLTNYVENKTRNKGEIVALFVEELDKLG